MKAELKIEEEPLFFIISLFGDAKLILITVNELNKVWKNHVKSKPFPTIVPLSVFGGRGYNLDTKVCLFVPLFCLSGKTET